MTEKFQLDHWTKNHFKALVLLCVSDSDDNMSEEEINEIIHHIHLEGKEEGIVDEVYAVIRILPIEMRLELIEKRKAEFPLLPNELEELLHIVEEIILADTAIEREEIAMYSKIKKLLEY